jgi:hypothetical protein
MDNIELILEPFNLLVLFYFLDYIIAPAACELHQIKNLIYQEEIMDLEPEAEKPILKFEIWESLHWLFNKATQGWILLGCLLPTDGSPYVEIGILYVLNVLVFKTTKNASLRDAFYRAISIAAIIMLIASNERFGLDLPSIFQ